MGLNWKDQSLHKNKSVLCGWCSEMSQFFVWQTVQRAETPLWYYTGPLFAPSWTIDVQHHEVCTDGSKINERVREAVIVNHHFQNGETTCCQLFKSQQHHLYCWGFSHHSGAGLSIAHRFSMAWCSWSTLTHYSTCGRLRPKMPRILLVLSDKSTCSFLPDTKPLWHWGKWPASKRYPLPWYIPTSLCSLYRLEATSKHLYPTVGSNQVGCVFTWLRSLSLETNTRTTQEIAVFNPSRGGCNYPTSTRPHHFDHWPYAPGVYSATGKSLWILHRWFTENSRLSRVAS